MAYRVLVLLLLPLAVAGSRIGDADEDLVTSKPHRQHSRKVVKKQAALTKHRRHRSHRHATKLDAEGDLVETTETNDPANFSSHKAPVGYDVPKHCDGKTNQPYDSTSMSRAVTAIVSSSPRHEDATNESTAVMKQVLKNIRDVLGLNTSRIIASFDGPNPNLTSTAAADYKRKIASIREFIEKGHLQGPAEVYEGKEWLHQANTLRRVFKHLHETNSMTPFLYITQDDSDVVPHIETSFIVNSLACDDTVEYVKFFLHPDCDTDKGNSACVRPVVAHPSGNMQRGQYLSDRPHFATTAFYEDTIMPHIKESGRHTPEQAFYFRKFPAMWTYGRRGEMLHDKNLLHDSLGVRTWSNV